MKKILSILFIAFVFISTCTEKTELPNNMETIDGIEYVHNTETPLYPNQKVNFVEDLTISPENNNEILLYFPHRIDVNGKGEIYIGDYQDSSIKVFDSNGKYLRKIGKRGNGPGEFQTVIDFSILPDGRYLVLDSDLMRLSIFSSDDQFITSHTVQNSGFSFFLTSPSQYVRGESHAEPGAKKNEIVKRLFVNAYELSGNKLFSYGEFAARQSVFVDIPNAFYTTPPFFVHSIFAGDNGNGWLYHCLNDKYVIEVYDKNGNIFRKIDRPYSPVKTTNEDMKRYVASFGNYSAENQLLIEKSMTMPPEKTITERMSVDDKGNLWIETNDTKEERESLLTAFDIFNEDGIYIFKVWLKITPGLFKDKYMYCLERDEETDYRLLKRYRVIWQEKNLQKNSSRH